MGENRENERRRTKRYRIRLRVIVESESVTFRTFSRDVSLGGIFLEKPLPDSLKHIPCTLIIGLVDGSENIRFSAALTTSVNDRRRLRFVKGTRSHLETLLLWLQNTIPNPFAA